MRDESTELMLRFTGEPPLRQQLKQKYPQITPITQIQKQLLDEFTESA